VLASGPSVSPVRSPLTAHVLTLLNHICRAESANNHAAMHQLPGPNSIVQAHTLPRGTRTMLTRALHQRRNDRSSRGSESKNYVSMALVPGHIVAS
jgi:hypothetical protein